MCLQLGLLTYYTGLLTIEIALTHAVVYKVSHCSGIIMQVVIVL